MLSANASTGPGAFSARPRRARHRHHPGARDDRTRIWRIRKRYVEQGLDRALVDQARPGRPREYDDKAKADLVALACSKPPTGYSRWSLGLLTAVARQQSAALKQVSEGKVRQVLKKKGLSLG